MRERAILYGLPVLCGLALLAVVFGPGAERVVAGARVYGVPVAGAKRFAFRVEVVDHDHGLVQPAPGEIALELYGDGKALGSWRGATDAAGWAEADGDLAEPLPAEAAVRVTRGKRVLADGPIPEHPGPALGPSSRCEESAGKVTVRVCLVRGVAVPELPEQIEVSAEGPAGDVKPTLEAKATGADLPHGTDGPVLVCRGTCIAQWRFELVARAPAVSLDLQATMGGDKGEYHGAVPLQPGGIWLDPGWRDGRALKLVAATPKTAAYLSIVAATGRVWGASLPLATDEHGFASGSLPLPDLAALGGDPFTLLVASDPAEPEGRVTAWPLSASASRAEPVPVGELADGLPAAIAGEKARMRAARLPVAGVILASAIAVLLTLLARARRARDALERHLEAEAGKEGKEAARVPLGLAVVVAAALALAFAIMAGIAAFG